MNPPEFEFQRTISKFKREIKFRHCLFMFSVKREIRHFHVAVCKKVCCTCKVVVLLIKPLLFCFLFFLRFFLVAIPTLDLKVPFNLTNSALFPVTAGHRHSYLQLELMTVYLVPVEWKTKRLLTVNRASEGAVVSWSVQRSRSLLYSQRRTYPNSSSFNPLIHKAV